MMTGIRMRLRILPLIFLLTGVLPVQACSPRLDGEPTYCGPQDGVVETPKYVEDWNRGKVTLVDTREDSPLVILDTYHQIVDKLRNWKAEQSRTPADSSIDQALEDFEWLEEE